MQLVQSKPVRAFEKLHSLVPTRCTSTLMTIRRRSHRLRLHIRAADHRFFRLLHHRRRVQVLEPRCGCLLLQHFSAAARTPHYRNSLPKLASRSPIGPQPMRVQPVPLLSSLINRLYQFDRSMAPHPAHLRLNHLVPTPSEASSRHLSVATDSQLPSSTTRLASDILLSHASRRTMPPTRSVHS